MDSYCVCTAHLEDAIVGDDVAAVNDRMVIVDTIALAAQQRQIHSLSSHHHSACESCKTIGSDGNCS